MYLTTVYLCQDCENKFLLVRQRWCQTNLKTALKRSSNTRTEKLHHDDTWCVTLYLFGKFTAQNVEAVIRFMRHQSMEWSSLRGCCSDRVHRQLNIQSHRESVTGETNNSPPSDDLFVELKWIFELFRVPACNTDPIELQNKHWCHYRNLNFLFLVVRIWCTRGSKQRMHIRLC